MYIYIIILHLSKYNRAAQTSNIYSSFENLGYNVLEIRIKEQKRIAHIFSRYHKSKLVYMILQE